MKITLASLVAVLLFASCGKKANDLSRYGYHGPVEQITTYKYANYHEDLDTTQFNFRTVYDYNTDGNVHFMQFVLNRSMFNQPSIAINYTYSFEDGKKTGWKENNLFMNDSTSKGTVEWPDKNTLVEKGFGGNGKLNYEIRTVLNSDRFEENVQILQYQDTSVYYNQKVVNVLSGDSVLYRVHQDMLENRTDTFYIETLERDEYGNATKIIESNRQSGEKQYVLKVFKYRKD